MRVPLGNVPPGPRSHSYEKGHGMLSSDVARKYDRLREILREMGSVAIGYSGGVDSTLLLKVSADVLGQRTVAMIGRSETYPTREFEEALALAKQIRAKVIVARTEETDDLKFQENPPDRCYFCKTELFGKLQEIAAQEGAAWIADGTITDDIGDFRPGMKAKSEKNVRSPLLEGRLQQNGCPRAVQASRVAHVGQTCLCMSFLPFPLRDGDYS